MKVPFFRHDLRSEDAQHIARVLDSPFLTSGDVGRAVEADLRAFFGVRHAGLVNSWTNGAVAALLALDIGEGHEVIVPALTFVATANVVELVGAKPVFVDVDPSTLLMTPEAVRAALTPATLAVLPVHLYGQPADVRGIRDVGLEGRPDVAIIEDAAHAFECQRLSRRPGADADAAIFSFYATKNITCGEGGALVTNRDDLYRKFLRTRLHGMSEAALDRFGGGGYQHWDMTTLGTKANLPDVLAALLAPQIANVLQRLPRRELLAQRYERAFAGTAVRVPTVSPGIVHSRHLFPIHVPPIARDRLLAGLGSRDIGATVNYRSVPTLTYYANKYGYSQSDFPVSHAWGSGTVSLPLFPSLTDAEQEYVIDTVLEFTASMQRDMGPVH